MCSVFFAQLTFLCVVHTWSCRGYNVDLKLYIHVIFHISFIKMLFIANLISFNFFHFLFRKIYGIKRQKNNKNDGYGNLMNHSEIKCKVEGEGFKFWGLKKTEKNVYFISKIGTYFEFFLNIILNLNRNLYENNSATWYVSNGIKFIEVQLICNHNHCDGGEIHY